MNVNWHFLQVFHSIAFSKNTKITLVKPVSLLLVLPSTVALILPTLPRHTSLYLNRLKLPH